MLPHPNRLLTPKGAVVHAIAEYIEGEYCIDFLKRVGLGYHRLITPKTLPPVQEANVINGVPLDRQAFHAGKSIHFDLNGLNSHYLSVAVMVAGDHDYASFVRAIQKQDWMQKEQLIKLVEIISGWCISYKLPLNRIAGHSQVSSKLVRDDPKPDPGVGFDWYGFLLKVANRINHESKRTA
jgi:N-acetyl-anhydromuramyl-L-alanine amidase AmpD